jgi:hypothetical protein
LEADDDNDPSVRAKYWMPDWMDLVLHGINFDAQAALWEYMIWIPAARDRVESITRRYGQVGDYDRSHAMSSE